MGGLYADVPAPRMAYHRDGSIGFRITPAGVISILSTAALQGMNDETDGTAQLTTSSETGFHYLGLIFPDLRDFVGYYVNGSWYLSHAGPAVAMEKSVDTTNGQDGTWAAIATPWSYRNETIVPNFRNFISAITATGIKAMRLKFTQTSPNDSGAAFIRSMHLYGTPNVAATRYLAVTDTGGTEVGGAYFDFDDDPRGVGTEVIQFKVKNLHGTLTANTITVGREVRSDKSPSFIDDYEFSDGGAYASSLSLGNLAPGASSGTLSIKRTTPIDAQLGLEVGLITVVAASWS